MYQEKMMLDFNAAKSVYKSYSIFSMDSAMDQEMRKPGYDFNKPMVIPKASWEQYFNFFADNSCYLIRPWFGGKISIKDTTVIDWSINAETKVIGGFTCNKATGNFAGRQYVAWYCPEIAVKAGPWKLHGLPGLILEASDTKEQVKFELQSLYNLNDVSIELPNGAKPVSKKEFRKMEESFTQNPMAVINTMLGNGENSNVSIAKTNGEGIPIKTPVKKNGFNNPLELTD